jgi:uncharacterized protein YndB with AHSA1/START domain
MSSTADREIVQTRLLDAPRELVWQVWTDPKHVDRWWGPRGFATVTRSMHVAVGSVWEYVMHGPDGTSWDNWTEYLEVEQPERLVYWHGARKDDPDRFLVTVTFEAEGDRTRLTMRSVFGTVEQLEAVKSFGAVDLGKQTIDKLVEHLASLR